MARSVVVHNGVSSYTNVALVTGGFFDVLGTQPLLGRTLTRADEQDGAEHVIVLGNGLWRRRYGASRDVLGRRLVLGEEPFTIVGVMPPDLDYPSGVDVWRTTSSVPASGPFGDAARREVNLIGRLRSGVTLEQATSEITTLTQRLEADAPANAPRGLVPVVRPFADVVVGDVRERDVRVICCRRARAADCQRECREPLVDAWRGAGWRACGARGAGGRARQNVSQVLGESAVLAIAGRSRGSGHTWWACRR